MHRYAHFTMEPAGRTFKHAKTALQIYVYNIYTHFFAYLNNVRIIGLDEIFDDTLVEKEWIF